MSRAEESEAASFTASLLALDTIIETGEKEYTYLGECIEKMKQHKRDLNDRKTTQEALARKHRQEEAEDAKRLAHAAAQIVRDASPIRKRRSESIVPSPVVAWPTSPAVNKPTTYSGSESQSSEATAGNDEVAAANAVQNATALCQYDMQVQPDGFHLLFLDDRVPDWVTKEERFLKYLNSNAYLNKVKKTLLIPLWTCANTARFHPFTLNTCLRAVFKKTTAFRSTRLPYSQESCSACLIRSSVSKMAIGGTSLNGNQWHPLCAGCEKRIGLVCKFLCLLGLVLWARRSGLASRSSKWNAWRAHCKVLNEMVTEVNAMQ